MPQNAEATRIFKALRRIVRAIDLRSREVARTAGLTIPQIVVLQAIRDLGDVTTKALSVQADLSAATVVTILDRLEERGLVARERSATDRRIVHARLTEEGRTLLERAPALLDEEFEARFARKDSAAQQSLASAIEEIAALMDAHRLDAAAILTTGEMTAKAPE
ncbi:MarR family winged helix-turn-helix transcriptional regulator [Pannonibacter phragmitetus]|uniref:MarR family winged helix-turn-helix transcriptional regulator n=1 Tax=Pannonibacter phragmitetus TaxID=121719 RepID=UPI000F018AB1|nr:MarR family transcriptional regulator [Pannonibacter phragmitetus]MBA4206347.1 MarR family transcriptional regulator [Polymorphum sp.]